MAAGQAGCPGRGTYRTNGVEAGKADPIFSHGVQVWRPDHLVAIEAGIAVSQIIRHKKDDIGWSLLLLCHGWRLQTGRQDTGGPEDG